MKWYVYLICFALVVSGVFCGLRLYAKLTAESYVNGSINIQNQFSMESFAYANTGLEFYHDIYDTTDTYTYTTDLLPVTDFNGQRHRYEIVLNDYVIIDTQITAGAVLAKVYLDFYDTSGDIICAASMDIKIEFLSNKTRLTFATVGGANASFISQYFRDNGVRLTINEILKGGL